MLRCIYGSTEAQNNRGGEGLLEIIYPKFKQGQNRLSMTNVQLGLRLWNFLGQSVLLSDHPCSKKECCARVSFQVFHFVPIASRSTSRNY